MTSAPTPASNPAMVLLRSTLIVLLLGLAAPVLARDDGASAGGEADVHATAVPDRPRPCLVCGKPVSPDDGVHLMHRGRRVHLCEGECAAHWHASPEIHFSQLQPRGALFNESAKEPDILPGGWLTVGLAVLYALVFATLTAYIAVGRGRAPLPWFFLGLVFTFLALIAVLVLERYDSSHLPQGLPKGMRKVATTHQSIRCHGCGAPNHPSAGACSRCGAALTPIVASDVQRAAGEAGPA